MRLTYVVVTLKQHKERHKLVASVPQQKRK